MENVFGPRGDRDARARALLLDAALQVDQLLGLDRDEHHVAQMPGPAAGRTPAPIDPVAPTTMAVPWVRSVRPHPDDGLFGRLERGGHREAVAAGDRDVGLVRHGDAGVAHHAGERAEAHDAGPEALGHARRLVETPVSETLAVLHHLARRRAERIKYPSTRCPVASERPPRIFDHEDRRHERSQRLHDRVREDPRPAIRRVLVDELDAEGMDDEREPVDRGLVRLQVTNRRRPVQVGDLVEVGVFAQRQRAIGTERDEHGLDDRGRPRAQLTVTRERRHERDENGRPTPRQVLRVLFSSPTPPPWSCGRASLGRIAGSSRCRPRARRPSRTAASGDAVRRGPPRA